MIIAAKFSQEMHPLVGVLFAILMAHVVITTLAWGKISDTARAFSVVGGILIAALIGYGLIANT